MSLQVPASSGHSIDDHVRGRQIERLERNLLGALSGYLIGVAMTCALFWTEWPLVLGSWAIGSVVVCGGRLVVAFLASRAPFGPRSQGALRRHAVSSAVMAAVMVAAPAWIVFHGEGVDATYMGFAVAALLWAGALVHVSVASSAQTFVAVQTVACVLIASAAGWDRANVAMAAVVCVAGGVAIDCVNRLSGWLEKGLRHQLHLEVQAAELKQQTETIALLLKEHEDESSDWLWQTDPAMAIRHPSGRFAAAFGRAPAEMERVALVDLMDAPHVDGNGDARAALRRHFEAQTSFRDVIVPGEVDGIRRWWSVSGRPSYDQRGRRIGFRGVMTDVTTEQQAQARVSHLAHYDTLTDLPNRFTFLQRLETRLATLGDQRVAVFYLDLDGFKLVNDRHGHAAGDALLVAVAERLRAATTNNDLVARLSGDEFVVKARVGDQAGLEALCKRLLKDLTRPFLIDDQQVCIGASAGIAIAPADGNTAEALLKNADAALYRAKQGGRGTYRFFAADLDHAMKDHAALVQDLRGALSKDEFVLHYQPFVDAGTGIITGYEALIRWQHPRRGMVSPLDFVPLAEESGMIVPIGGWVIRTACAEAATWADDRRVSVNISPVQFQDRDLPARILSALVDSGLPAHRLEIELTETIFVSDIDQALAMLRRIRALGVRVALDDFGTGFSSLSYLQSFPFDKIKIDRSFVRDLSTRPDSQVIVRAVGDIARGLHMTITAEGVETREQATLLQIAGCHELQGFLYGRPARGRALAAIPEDDHGALAGRDTPQVA